jgi:hypothetical protein
MSTLPPSEGENQKTRHHNGSLIQREWPQRGASGLISRTRSIESSDSWVPDRKGRSHFGSQISRTSMLSAQWEKSLVSEATVHQGCLDASRIGMDRAQRRSLLIERGVMPAGDVGLNRTGDPAPVTFDRAKGNTQRENSMTDR